MAISISEIPVNYVDPECSEAEKNTVEVSSFVAGIAFNDLCNFVGGRWPDAKIQEEAPELYAFFMKIFESQ